ncbi:hypothetical protein KY362_06100 [Candidatus Woesearchaeota archaeon]|nr:hypothetical protein [Candidatus Woesearchaeota archaeon]
MAQTAQSPEKRAQASDSSPSDDLQARLYAVVDTLPDVLPSTFKDGARIAADHFIALETGEGITDEIDLFAKQLAATGYASNCIDSIVPAAYPAWVTERRGHFGNQLNWGHMQSIEDFFYGYAWQHAADSTTTRNGTYLNFGEDMGVPQGKSHLGLNQKAYIEGANLVEFKALRKMLADMSSADIHPPTMKLFDSRRLVLYWPSLPEEAKEKVVDIADDAGIVMRGPGQDSFVLATDRNGALQEYTHMSNDEGLGEHSGWEYSWRSTKYDPVAFFKGWLAQTFIACKQPHRPYQLAFILADAGLTGVEGFIEKVKDYDSAGLPVLVVDESGMIDVFDKKSEDHLIRTIE